MSRRHPTEPPRSAPGNSRPHWNQNAGPATRPRPARFRGFSWTADVENLLRTRLHAVRRHAREAPPEPSPPSPGMAAQLRAAEVMGRILDFFEAIEYSTGESLEEARGRLVDELEDGRGGWGPRPHDRRRRNAVLTAALACIHVASDDESHRYGWLTCGSVRRRTGGDPGTDRLVGAGQVVERVHRVLDVGPIPGGPAPAAWGPRESEILAHMLQGPEPGTWSRDQRDFARCTLEWLKASAPESPTEA